MISTISPLVQEAPGQWRRSIALYLVGSIAGGVALFGAAGWVGRLVLPAQQTTARWTVAGLAVLACALHEFGVLGLPLPRNYHSVPQSWWRHLGPSRAAFSYGVVLGVGVTTVIPFAGFYAVLAWAFLLANPVYAVVLGGSYGLARAFPVLAASRVLTHHVGRDRPHEVVAELTARVDSKREGAHIATGVAAVGFASAVAVAVILRLWS